MELISIGNSKGIRLSKTIIDKYHFENGLNIVEDNGYVKLVPKIKKLRNGWKEFFLKNYHNVDVDTDFLEFDIDSWDE